VVDARDVLDDRCRAHRHRRDGDLHRDVYVIHWIKC
jgi:hypothetical protein